MKSFTFMTLIILIVLSIASSSFCEVDNIPLPSSKDMKKYFMENFSIRRWGSEIDLDIMRIESLPYDRIFSKHRIFKVHISRRNLEIKYPGTFISSGYFSTDGKEILYLNWTDTDNIETLFKNENIQIDKLDATTFCSFLCQTLLTYESSSYKVISSVSEIIDFAHANKGYEVNNAEIGKFESDIHPPKISGNKESGWEVEFYSWGGWIHKVTIVSRHLFKISGQYKIQHRKEILTKQIFSKVPRIIY